MLLDAQIADLGHLLRIKLITSVELTRIFLTRLKKYVSMPCTSRGSLGIFMHHHHTVQPHFYPSVCFILQRMSTICKYL